jgi:hypothetical protein
MLRCVDLPPPVAVTIGARLATVRPSLGGGQVPDRLLVDIDRDGRTLVSAWLDGELPAPVGDPVELAWPLMAEELEDLR